MFSSGSCRSAVENLRAPDRMPSKRGPSFLRNQAASISVSCLFLYSELSTSAAVPGAICIRPVAPPPVTTLANNSGFSMLSFVIRISNGTLCSSAACLIRGEYRRSIRRIMPGTSRLERRARCRVLMATIFSVLLVGMGKSPRTTSMRRSFSGVAGSSLGSMPGNSLADISAASIAPRPAMACWVALVGATAAAVRPAA